MSDIRAPDTKEQAKEDYLKGMKYKDLAEKYNVTINTIKSWKQRYEWDRKGVHTKDKKGAHKKKSETVKKDTHPIAETVEIDNPALTDKHKLFCTYYVKYRNKTKAYMKAYQCSYESACAHAYELWKNVEIIKEIDRLLKELRDEIKIDAQDIIQKYIDIAFTDITDFLIFGQEEVPVMSTFGPVLDEDGNQVTKMVNTVKFRTWSNVDGTLISEISQGKDGAKLKLHDKVKALDFLAKHIGLLDAETQQRLKIEEQKLEIAKIKAGNIEDPEVEDDGFIEALKGKVSEVWTDEDTE